MCSSDLGLMDDGTEDLFDRHGLIPVLNSPGDIERWSNHARANGGRSAILALDTGMSRLGLTRREAETLAQTPSALDGIGLEYVMSHLACADEPDHPMNAYQLDLFRRMTDGTGVPRSFAATGGILLGKDYHFEITRPGIGLYGGQPFAAARPVVRLDLPVAQVRHLEAGEVVGYGNSWRARRPSRIASVVAGYADGLLRSLSNKGALWAGDVPCPLVGRVSMDTITVDVTDLEEVPSALMMIGPNQSFDDLASVAGTIGYEILTSLGSRYNRRYHSA